MHVGDGVANGTNMGGEQSVSRFDRRTAGKAIAGFLVAAAILYFFGRVIGWREISRTLADANPLWFGLACLSTLVSLVVWSKSWDVILDLVGIDVRFRTLVVTYLAATFADYATPFGKAGGGPFIAYVLAADTEASYEDSLASVVTADTLNLLPYFTFAALGFVVVFVRGSIPAGARYLIGGLGVLAVVVPGLLYAGWRHRTLAKRVVMRVLGPVERRTDRIDAAELEGRIEEFYDHVDTIAGDRDVLARTLVYAYVGWLFFALPLYLAGMTLGFAIDPLLVLFIVPASSLAGVVPTPGGLGGVEFALVGLLVALTPLSPGSAAAVALVYRVASYWLTLAVGGLAAFSVIYRS